MDDDLAYTITHFAFNNPLRLLVDLFSPSNSQLLLPKVSYLLVDSR